MEVGRYAASAAHWHDREHVIKVPVGEKCRHRTESMLPDDVLERASHADTWIDHEALFASTGRHYVAIRRERWCREADDEHAGNRPLEFGAIMRPSQGIGSAGVPH
jgi:hypothetical protein